jgi:signal transduction histidine kinase
MSPARQEFVLILVISEDAGVRSYLRQELEQLAYPVMEADDAQVGLMLFKQQQPNLVLLDLDVAGVDEFGYCAKLRSLKDDDQIAVLVLVDPLDAQVIDQVMAAGADDILSKSTGASLFKKRVRQAVEIRQLQKQLGEQEQRHRTVSARVQSLEHSHGLQDEFLSTVIHELRTPLTNMKVASQLVEMLLQQVQKGLVDHPAIQPLLKASSYLQTLKGECERETVLINNLLDLQHLDSGMYPLELIPIDLQVWLPQIADSFYQATANRQQILRTQIAENLLPFLSSAVSLERILNELLHNACKYTPPGETIQITAEQAQANIMQLTVSNSGVEIPASEQARIFEKFYRIPRSDKWKQGGSGLGLALVKKLVTHLGGTIHLCSETGQTAFVIQLPISGPEAMLDLEAS